MHVIMSDIKRISISVLIFKRLFLGNERNQMESNVILLRNWGERFIIMHAFWMMSIKILFCISCPFQDDQPS